MQTILIVISSVAALCVLLLIIELAAKGLWIAAYFKLGPRVYYHEAALADGEIQPIIQRIDNAVNAKPYLCPILFHKKPENVFLFREKMVSWGNRMGLGVSYLPIMAGILKLDSGSRTLSVSGHVAIAWPLAMMLMSIMMVTVFGLANGGSKVLPFIIGFAILILLIVSGVCFLMYRVQKKRYDLIVKELNGTR
jgi:hypothetical protein